MNGDRWSPRTLQLLPAMERHVIVVHRLGPRATLELLLELAAEYGDVPRAAALLARYASLDPEAVRVAGGDRLPCRRLRLVPAA